MSDRVVTAGPPFERGGEVALAQRATCPWQSGATPNVVEGATQAIHQIDDLVGS